MSTQYRKKPDEIIEALQWNGETSSMMEFLADPCEQNVHNNSKNYYIELDKTACINGTLIIHTTDNYIRADLGDYIVKDNEIGFYSCNKEEFESVYERVL